MQLLGTSKSSPRQPASDLSGISQGQGSEHSLTKWLLQERVGPQCSSTTLFVSTWLGFLTEQRSWKTCTRNMAAGAATRTVKGHSWTWRGMPSIPAFYWSSLPSLRSIGQAFHPCILLVKPSIPVFYWSSLPSLCPIGQTFHPYVPLVKPSIPTSYWSKQSQDPPIFKGVEQWTALLCGGCQGH